MRLLHLLIALLATPAALAADYNARDEWWWDTRFWEDGQLATVTNHEVETRWITYKSDGMDIPALVARPKKAGRYPAVLYQHGRRGLDEMIQLQVKRLAARGFVVLAPDVYRERLIPPNPVEHDYAVEGDVNRGVDALLALPDISTRKACLVSHTRGGYMTLKVAVTHKRQDKDIVCYVSWYPHWQDPNAPEALQVYSFAAEAEQLKIPTLVFIGEQEQYQRRRTIEFGIKALTDLKRPAQLVVYPGVGRGFDFRPPNVRTFADDLAAKDSLARTAAFLNRHLTGQR
jgi:carboxymethylenebutenolidase